MTKPKRVRVKQCSVCGHTPEALFRVQYAATGGAWVFVCAGCRRGIEADNPESYQYGGTWKRKKRH